MMKLLSIPGIPYPGSLVFKRDAMRGLDNTAAEFFGIPSMVLMENAGRAMAGAALSLLEGSGSKTPVREQRFRFCAFCGGGNNGGDGFVAARHLRNLGHDVAVIFVTPADRMSRDTRNNFEITVKFGIPVIDCSMGINPEAGTAAASADLIFDCLLGTGVSKAPRGVAADAIELINSLTAPVVSADLPSGLDSDTGALPGKFVRATATVTFGGIKPGLLIYPGAGAAGQVMASEIGIPRMAAEAGCRMVLSGPAMVAGILPPVRRDTHKGINGRVFIVGGFDGYSGAAVISAIGALRSGAGLVTVAAPRNTCRAMVARIPEAMTLELPAEGIALVWPPFPAAFRCDAMAIGPGLGDGDGRREIVQVVAAGFDGPLVIDADGLNRLAEAGASGILSSRPGPTLLTPHPGEMARLTGASVAEVLDDPLTAALSLAASTGAVVHLKGPTSVTASPEGTAVFCVVGSPGMAKGGSGDLLTGLAVGLAARGLDLFDAAWGAAWLLGRASEIAAGDTHPDWILPTDTAAALPRVLAEVEIHRSGTAEVVS